METHYFALRDGKIVHVPDVPEKITVGGKTFEGITDSGTYEGLKREYEQALQSAIANAIEVENQEKVKNVFMKNGGKERDLHPSTIYPLQCRVEKIEKRRYRLAEDRWSKWYEFEPHWVDGHLHESITVARVTFDEQPEKKDDVYVEDEGTKMIKEAFAKVRELANEPEAAGQEQETQHKCIYCNGTGYSNKPPLGQ